MLTKQCRAKQLLITALLTSYFYAGELIFASNLLKNLFL